MTTSIFDLSGETAVVLGGTGVLGGGMASALAAAGAKVAVVGRSEERGMARVKQIEAAGGTAIFQSADALDAASLTAARDAIIGKLGSVTILVAAAGGNRPDATLPPGSDFCKLSRDGWNGVFDLNLVGGALLPAQVFGETMLAQTEGQHHQYRFNGRHDSAVASRRIFCRESCRDQLHEVSRSRMGDARCASQCDQSWILSRRSEPCFAVQRRRIVHGTRRSDYRAYSDVAFW